ncbi:MAG TPA: histidine kinase dimerization/phospho-acceptor domain-containing protein [Candidatus Acidoferrales bacterium]|nr:histidine kinase dimerization/phospho-acceptor domain-containing protein [Candidatus Acidoferrales bacterium]
MTTGTPSIVLAVTPEEGTAERLSRWLADSPAECEIHHTASLRDARRLIDRLEPAVIYYEAANLTAAEARSAVRGLARYAPVVAAVNPEAARELAVLVVAGGVDCVAAGGEFLELTAALLERRLRSGSRLLERVGEAEGEEAVDFGSLLRHELNNPLTGILGNAEMLLNRRQQLPEEAVLRLETIADLAVRLRETIRRLSSATEARQRPQHIG